MTTNEGEATPIELSRAEQWLIHHLMLDSIGLAAMNDEPEDPPRYVLRILETLETESNTFSTLELDHIRYACGAYTRENDIPDADREVATAIVRKINDALGDEGLPTTTTA